MNYDCHGEIKEEITPASLSAKILQKKCRSLLITDIGLKLWA